MGENIKPITIQMTADPNGACKAIARAIASREWRLVSEREDRIGTADQTPSDIDAELVHIQANSDLADASIDQHPTFILADRPRVQEAVNALRHGARDYRVTPTETAAIQALLDEIEAAVADIHPDSRISDQTASASKPPRPRPHQRQPSDWLAISEQALMVRQRADRAAEIDANVLITGPSGTGKTALARMIHAQSDRAARPMITVSCGALPRELIESELFGHTRGAFTGATAPRVGRFEEAEGGTILLDEIGELPIELQPKLLNVLQDRTVSRVGGSGSRPVDVRVIAATNRDLEALVASGDFREDLFYRLNVVRLEVPPLSGRDSDILALIDEVLRRQDPPIHITAAARAAMLAYQWPGNIRELLNVMERAAAFCEEGTIDTSDLALPKVTASPSDQAGRAIDLHPSDLTLNLSDAQGPLAGQSLQTLERAAILANMEAHAGNRAAVARTLGVSEKTIYNKIKRYGLNGSS